MTDTAMSTDAAVVTDTNSAPPRTNGAQPATPAAVAYQGLPAKFKLPWGERSSGFSQQLLRTDRPQTAFLIAISYGLTNWIGVLLALFPIVMLWNDRHRIADTIRMYTATPAPAPE
jgi:hypothetical protein